MWKLAKAPTTEYSVSASVMVTEIEESLTIEPPVGYRASVVMRESDKVKIGGRRYTRYVVWLLVGRDGNVYNAAEYVHGGGYAARIDIPDGVTLSDEYLRTVLEQYLPSDRLPPDTGVIVKIGG